MLKGTHVTIFILTAMINHVVFAQENITNPNSVASLSSMLQNPDFSSLSKNLSIIFQLGVFYVNQGKSQNIDIDGLIGDRFTVDHHHAQNYFFGVAAFIDGIEQEKFKLKYGVNAFYFAHTQIKGNVIQEQMFTNLNYRYSIRQIPIYVATKAFINTNCSKYNVSLDFGVGPNIIKTYHFREQSLDGGVTIPDTIFSGQSNVVLSATAGIGIRINNVLNHMPIECGYRFFYLGRGKLKKINSQVQNTLTTGTTFANTLIFSVSI